MVDIVVIGHILNEKIIFPDREIYPVLGSPVAYSSVCMASLGTKVGIATKIGKDFPKSLFKTFDEVGVNKEGVTVGLNSTNNELIYDKYGNKTLKFLKKAENIYFSDIPQAYFNARIFCISPMDYEIDLDTIKAISKTGKILAADIGGYGGGTSDTHPEVKNGYEIEEICQFIDIIKGSIEDFRHILNPELGDEREIAKRIINWGAKISLITLGERGSYLKTEKDEVYIPPYPTNLIIDRTGAGDCFLAGFLTKFLISNEPYISSIYGTAATSYVIERTGGVTVERMPDLKELDKRATIMKSLTNC